MPHTDIIEERLRFLEIDQDVTNELRNAKQILEPEMDRMLDQFYSHILSEPQMKQIFADDKAIERAREAQKKHWLKRLFGGAFKSAYFDQARLIGRAHARVGLTPNWYIGGYCNMLVKFVRHISDVAPKEGRDAGPIIEATCKAVFLDLDLVIDCYLEAKDRTMLDLLMRSTRFADELTELNSELSLAAAQVKVSTEALSKDATENDQQERQLATLLAQTDAMADKVKQIEDRISELKTGDRLYLHRGTEHTGTFAKLRALVLGE